MDGYKKHIEHEGEHVKETIKKQAHHSSIPRNGASKKLIFMALVLGVLVIVGLVQATELVGLKNKLNSDLSTLNVGTGSSSSVGSSGSSSAGSLKSSLDNLPTMVGGC